MASADVDAPIVSHVSPLPTIERVPGLGPLSECVQSGPAGACSLDFSPINHDDGIFDSSSQALMITPSSAVVECKGSVDEPVESFVMPTFEESCESDPAKVLSQSNAHVCSCAFLRVLRRVSGLIARLIRASARLCKEAFGFVFHAAKNLVVLIPLFAMVASLCLMPRKIDVNITPPAHAIHDGPKAVAEQPVIQAIYEHAKSVLGHVVTDRLSRWMSTIPVLAFPALSMIAKQL